MYSLIVTIFPVSSEKIMTQQNLRLRKPLVQFPPLVPIHMLDSARIFSRYRSEGTKSREMLTCSYTASHSSASALL